MHLRKWSVGVAACTIFALSGIVPAAQAATTYEYTPIPQANMRAVAADSVETTGEGANGPIEKVLDADQDTYWHTKWQTGIDPLPHWFIIDLGSLKNNLGRVTLTPRQSSNGSGRMGRYKLEVSTDPQCAVKATAQNAAYTVVKEDKIPATPEEGALADVNLDFTPTAARCVKVTYKSTWGGNNSPETVGSLAEFEASVATAVNRPDQPQSDGPKITVPDGALEITDGLLQVRTHPAFPQVVDYRLNNKQIAGKYGDPITQIKINSMAHRVNVGTATVSADRSAVTYPLTIPDLAGVEMKAVLSVREGVLSYKLTEIKDPNKVIRTISIPELDLVSVNGKDRASQIFAAKISVNRAASGDRMIDVANSRRTTDKAFMVTLANSELAAGFETNAISSGDANISDTDARFRYAVTEMSGQKVGKVSPASWVYRGHAVAQYDQGNGIGVDPDPMVKVKIVADVNKDGKVDWQDGATATRDVLTPANGRDEIKNYVVMRIPFNIVSQATHPFLRTLDDTKRISLATDNLGQEVLLKGYQAEGHDSAQGDYGGNYNQRAGGLKDMKKLVNEGKNWNATFGIHVNATETYSEANCFADANNLQVKGVAAPCEIYLPPAKAWGWMNQSYYMNEKKDLATGNVLKRLKQLRAEFPIDSNMNWLYWDVYYKHGWQAQRFASEMQKQGWRLGSEWAYSMPQYSTWSHWATDEKYGGQATKGINSKLIRYVENSYRDTFNPDPMLGNANIVDFEGWTGHVDYNAFIKNVWERNLPVKFLQQSHIKTWENGKITFENGTTVTSTQTYISGTETPVDRTITYDGATVFKKGGSYLLPWKNGGADRLYYWNPSNAPQSWELTNSFKSQSSLTLFKLTDTGREKVADLTVSNGKVNIPATSPNTAYVLYPKSNVPAVKAVNWGEGSGIADPGFFSGTLDSYQTTGDVSIEHSARKNTFAQLGAGEATLEQTISVEPGTYSAWAWVEIQPGKTRKVAVSVSGEGVKPAPAQAGEAGNAVTEINASSAMNATASDEKRGTYYQRVPVHFTTTGNSVKFKVAAAKGDAVVGIDDLRIVKRPTPAQEGAVKGTIAFEDFENVDTGYYPFVTGIANAGGDARTQLAKLHPPFSQSGWYGVVNDSPTGIDGQKYLDNVLDGEWSLLAHQENGGKILRTTQATVPLQPGHTYKLMFDYQTAFANDYAITLGYDTPNQNRWTERVAQTWPLAVARGKGWEWVNERGTGTAKFAKVFAVTEDSPAFIGVTKSGGKSQGDLVIDNFRVVDLGSQPVLSITGVPQTLESSQNATMLLTTKVSVPEGEITDVTHQIVVPDGWTATPVTAGGNVAKGGQEKIDSLATWKLTMPKDADLAEITFKATWKEKGGKAGSGTETLQVDPSTFPKHDFFKGRNQLEVVSVNSEETGGEPTPNGFATAAIDDNAATYWHTAWSANAKNYPHEIVLKVKPCEGKGCTFTGLEFTQRQNAENGRPKGYQIFVSQDGINWGNPVATGNFTADTAPQFISFAAGSANASNGVQGRYVKLVETSPLKAGNPWGGAAEIRIAGKVSSAGELKTVDKVIAPKAVDPAKCAVKPYVTIPDTLGVIYQLDGKPVSAGIFTYEYGKSVEVRAVAADGYKIADDAEVTWKFTAPKPGDCDAPGGSGQGGDNPGGSTPGGSTPGGNTPGGSDPSVPHNPSNPGNSGNGNGAGSGDNSGTTGDAHTGNGNANGIVPPTPRLAQPQTNQAGAQQNGSNLARTGSGVAELIATMAMLACVGGALLRRRAK